MSKKTPPHAAKNKGFALVNVLVMMILIVMLCMLIMSVAVYNTNMAKKATLAFENRLEVDIIGDDFLREKGNLLNAYLTKQCFDDDGLPILDEGGNPTYVYSYVEISEGVFASDKIQSAKRIISLTHEGNIYTLNVTSKGGETLLSVTQNITTAKVLKWNYGTVAPDYAG